MICLALAHTMTLKAGLCWFLMCFQAHAVGNSEAGLKVMLSEQNNVLKYRTEAECFVWATKC